MNRRELLKVLGASLASGRVAALAGGPSFARKYPLGIQLYTVRTLMAKDVEDTLEALAKIGYREVEFAGFYGKSAKEIRALMDHFKLTSPASHIGFDIMRDEAKWSAALDDAAVLGQPYIVCPWLDAKTLRTVDDWKRMAGMFNVAATKAKARGIQFAYHNHDFEFVPVDGKLPYDVLLAESDPELVKMEMDLFWITKNGQDPLVYFAKYPGRFPLVHVKDRDGSSKMVDVGSGMLDFKRIFAKAKQAGIKHYLVEHDQPASPLESAKHSYEGLRRLVG